MKILGREEQWIHTHFLTDCLSLSESRMQEVAKAMTPHLRELGIVYGMHFTQVRDERTCRIVLECIPFAKTLDRIQQQLQSVVRDIPARPAVTKTVREEQSGAILPSSR
ncbi:MAG: hypothetical protein HY267_04885 [Deltaproteobacteria bacterium]|nr:hypothetical protein [Deltaproteobacteria bacterium]